MCCKAWLLETRLIWRGRGRCSDPEAQGLLIQELSQAGAFLGMGPRVLTGDGVLGQGPG